MLTDSVYIHVCMDVHFFLFLYTEPQKLWRLSTEESAQSQEAVREGGRNKGMTDTWAQMPGGKDRPMCPYWNLLVQ